MTTVIIAFLLLIFALTLNFYVVSTNEGFTSSILGLMDSSGNVNVQGVFVPMDASGNRLPTDSQGNVMHKDGSGNTYVIDSSGNVIYTNSAGVPLNNMSTTLGDLITMIFPYIRMNPNGTTNTRQVIAVANTNDILAPYMLKQDALMNRALTPIAGQALTTPSPMLQQGIEYRT